MLSVVEMSREVADAVDADMLAGASTMQGPVLTPLADKDKVQSDAASVNCSEELRSGAGCCGG